MREKMKQALLIAFLAGCLFAQQIPAVAHENEPESDYAREVLALLQDPQYTEAITLVQDVDVQDRSCIEIAGPEGHEKVLDLNGHTVSLDGLYNFANLLLTDSVGGGKLILTSTLYNQGGSLTISGINVVRTKDAVGGAAICNYWPGMFCLESGTVDATQVQFAIENKGGTCVIDGGEIHGRNTAVVSRHGTQLYGISGQDESGEWWASTGTRWYDGALTLNGGLIEGDIETYDTDVTITGGVVRGTIVMKRSFEYKDGCPIKLETPQKMQYYNSNGEVVTLPDPTYELHEENGEMKRGYWDVSVDDWFYVPVQRLMDDGVLDYGEDGNFEPSGPLTRGQAAALLARACGAEVAEEVTEPPFLDVFSSTPYAKYINAGRRAGLLSGDGRGQFHPESAVTWQEFAVLVMNAVHKYGLELPAEAPGVAFQDEGAIAPWARDAVAEGAGFGLWKGTDGGDFLPLNPISRAEGAAILARLMESADICP